ncbi:hypothetical protein PSSM2_153 [Prochlorococcus phage P-SSM2]|jgi:hypothetical protein|uniref:Uncharacterized protein n=2 Tax=Salacisavirus pssm2 TaxID=2734140 RepID=Q58MK1_BPPRM|nr:hypothetical protein PSSM2_153 [Prochlorococcus phage P-SSM2]AAX44531.1 hypothetical protein PSSM2_153 [Prochlorococcus phage P-SSM2]ACY76032.1 conserved hypothetical protein [Prochlorococcus phage P-SSM2]AGN12439.1 hypothetical protein PRTG_00290 [Prochlorococcus phage P-SSM5]
MSKFSDFAHLGTTTHESGVTETTAPPVAPTPPEPVVEEYVPPVEAPPTTPPEYENPLDDMPVAVAPSAEAEAFSVDDLQWMSKIKLEEIGRSLGVELDRRLSQPKLVRQLKEVIEQQQD